MKNMSRLLRSLLTMACLLGFGCSFFTFGPARSNDGPPQAGTAPAGAASGPAPAAPEAAADDGGTASLAEGPITPAALNLPALGSVAFAVDAAASVSAAFVPGSQAVLELTDGAGLTWTLTVPENALDAPQTLTMTALSGLQSGDLPGRLAGGVLLEPDGLQFFAPALLAVSGLDGPALLLTGRHDGSQVDPALMTSEPGRARLLHFSTAFSNTGDDQAMQEMYKTLDAEQKAVIEEVKQVLKDKNIQVPVPPSIPVECVDEKQQQANEQQIQAFLDAVNQPEGVLIGKLLAIKTAKAHITGETEGTFDYEMRLQSRLVKKARLLLKTYYGQAERLEPVGRAALLIMRQYALLEGGSHEDQGEVLQELGRWYNKSIDQMLDDVVNQHDYHKAQAVWTFARRAALLGVEQYSVEDLQSKLQAAMTFDLQTELDMFITSSHEWLMNSEFILQYNPEEGKWGDLTGSGQGSLEKYTDHLTSSQYATAPPFNINARITNFDACAGSATLIIDRYYPDFETYYDPEDEDDKPFDMSLCQVGWNELYRSFNGADGFALPLALRNKQANAVEQEIPGDGSNSGGEAHSTFNVTLVHKPRR